MKLHVEGLMKKLAWLTAMTAHEMTLEVSLKWMYRERSRKDAATASRAGILMMLTMWQI